MKVELHRSKRKGDKMQPWATFELVLAETESRLYSGRKIMSKVMDIWAAWDQSPCVSIPADNAQLTFMKPKWRRGLESKWKGCKREGRRERKERDNAGTCNGQTSINQALSMGYGIYREQPNAMAINQGLECQLYQYPLQHYRCSCAGEQHTHTHTPEKTPKNYYFCVFTRRKVCGFSAAACL